MRHSGELNPEYAWAASINDRPLSAGRALPANALQTKDLRFEVSGLIRRETNLIEFERDEGAGALYYTAHLNLELPVDEIQPFSRGIEISRSYTLVSDESSALVKAGAGGALTISNSMMKRRSFTPAICRGASTNSSMRFAHPSPAIST
ncbi:MAG: hypothetical protein OXG23_03105 [Chloroflexi bacterium]|nr:hypothetical protein [Chloroflexota bacterium]